MTADSVEEVLEQLGRGELAALGELFAAYAPYLRAIVRGQLSDRLRAKFDSVDVVQSVWVQVIRRLGQDGWQVNDESHLRALLVTIARRRLVTRARRCAIGAKTDRPLGEELTAVSDPRSGSPSEAAQANDLWGRMLDLVPPAHQQILILRREGLPLAEIAARTGLHEGSVRRVIRRLARELALREEPLIDLPPDEPE
jgi:RNA polymerase sigma-70 factor (ECF subfamily)